MECVRGVFDLIVDGVLYVHKSVSKSVGDEALFLCCYD